MAKKIRTVVTQAMCDHAKILLAGGAKTVQAAEILGVGESTVYRMKRAGFSAEKYNENKEKEQKGRLTADPVKMELQQAELPGQIKMELPVKETEEQTKMMRFQAAMVDRLIVEMDKFNDTLNQFLRAMTGI